MSEHDWTGTCPVCRGLCVQSPGHALVNAHLAHVAGQLADAMTFEAREQRWSDVFDAAWDSGEPLLPVLIALADQEIAAAVASKDAELRREIDRVTLERANGRVLVVNQSLLSDLVAREVRALGERDRARATAVALEAELAAATEHES